MSGQGMEGGGGVAAVHMDSSRKCRRWTAGDGQLEMDTRKYKKRAVHSGSIRLPPQPHSPLLPDHIPPLPPLHPHPSLPPTLHRLRRDMEELGRKMEARYAPAGAARALADVNTRNRAANSIKALKGTGNRVVTGLAGALGGEEGGVDVFSRRHTASKGGGGGCGGWVAGWAGVWGVGMQQLDRLVHIRHATVRVDRCNVL
jgi:hypothetical protein